MNTKSQIQLLAEQADKKIHLYNQIQKLFEKYDMKNTILNNQCMSLDSGYIVILKQNIDLTEAVKNLDENKVLWINHDKQISLCNYYRKVSDIPDGAKSYAIQ